MKLGGKYHELLYHARRLRKNLRKTLTYGKKDRDIEHENEDERGRGHEA